MNKNTPQILKVENLKVVFDSAKGYITAAKDVNFALRKGEILALVGESGSGADDKAGRSDPQTGNGHTGRV